MHGPHPPPSEDFEIFEDAPGGPVPADLGPGTILSILRMPSGVFEPTHGPSDPQSAMTPAWSRVAPPATGNGRAACPFCGGKDRFRVQPAKERWWCRQCSPDGRWKTASPTFAAVTACRPRGQPSCRTADAHGMPAPPCRCADFHPSAWRERRGPVPQQKPRPCLWSQTERRTALAERRGLQTRRCGAGRWASAAAALRTTCTSVRASPAVIVEGDVLADQGPTAVTARTAGPKYVSVSGDALPVRRGHAGRPPPAGADEGEFDASAVAGRPATWWNLATVGGCSSRPPAPVLWYLTPYRHIFIAYTQTPRRPRGRAAAHLVHPPASRPPPGARAGRHGFHLDGGSLRSWVQFLPRPASSSGSPDHAAPWRSPRGMEGRHRLLPGPVTTRRRVRSELSGIVRDVRDAHTSAREIADPIG